MTNVTQNNDIERIDDSIRMLQTYVVEDEIKPLISALEDLKKDPNNESLLVQLSDEFDNLNMLQGAVLTYAPYVSILLSDDLFEDS